MEEYINDNGQIIKKNAWSISPDNRSFRYGDGCFETIKLINNRIILADYHFQRLFNSLELLKFDRSKDLTSQRLSREILELANRNNHHQHARVRLTFYRGEGGLYDEISQQPNYLIQTWAQLNDVNQLNNLGLAVDFFPDARKAADRFSHIKSNNFLPYAMGALWAKQNQLDDAIILNSFGNVADATIANIFIVKDGTVYTPPLSEGLVNGVMRRYILKCLQEEGIPIHEASVTREEVLQASEVFFTNALYGLRWVRQVAKSNYACQMSTHLHQKFISSLFN
ncbi:MAG TPA: aminotransferase class IV [Segetibacter sp.]